MEFKFFAALFPTFFMYQPDNGELIRFGRIDAKDDAFQIRKSVSKFSR
jgi:hypothetical protein